MWTAQESVNQSSLGLSLEYIAGTNLIFYLSFVNKEKTKIFALAGSKFSMYCELAYDNGSSLLSSPLMVAVYHKSTTLPDVQMYIPVNLKKGLFPDLNPSCFFFKN